MILPARSRSMRSMGWMISERTRITSPALMVAGTRSRTLPMSDMMGPLPAAAADGDLHFTLDLQQRAVALLHDGAHVARLAQPHVGRHVGLPGFRGERHPRDDGNAVLVRHHVDVLDVVGGRHR